MPRGLRNNNPGNLIKGMKPFLGEKFPSTDPRFRQFETIEYGYRAGLKLLVNFISQGYNTIGKIINRWAPPVENNTNAYIQAVSKKTGIDVNKVLTTDQGEAIIKIMAAISLHENGVEPDISAIRRGWELLSDKKKN